LHVNDVIVQLLFPQSPTMAPGVLPGAMVDSFHTAQADTGLVHSPLPDPVVAVVQWVFQRPGWMMISGLVVGVIVAAFVVRYLWRHRRQIWTWLATRSRGTKILMASTVGVFLLAVAGVGYKVNYYMEHDNNFCRGCHVFIPAGQPFVRPDTGTYLIVNQLQGKHDTLECHDCHLPNKLVQAQELVLWMVDRPDKVPPHEKVRPEVCKGCHQLGAAKKFWQEIVTTAGHRVHFENDSLKKKNIECLTCHARSAHHFVPVDSTCAQQGCHLTADVSIKLGKMAGQTGLHCAVCHAFTAEVPKLATVDSATGTLRPGDKQCFSCHQMRVRAGDFDPARDPHKGKCGMCHNPHTNVKPADALKSCATSGCHSDWEKVEFHTGKIHRQAVEHCETCHTPHAARVDASDCAGCHERVRGSATGRGLKPPLPFDTTKALRSVSAVPDPIGPHGKGDAPPDEDPPAALFSRAPADSFEHARHKDLPCLTCHTTSSKSADLSFKPPRGCQTCHHTAAAGRECRDCHDAAGMAAALPVSVTITVPEHAPVAREVPFQHARHQDLACRECHSTPVTLEPAPAVRQCQSCHAQHHTEAKDCAACHAGGHLAAPHTPPAVAHEQCADCHTPANVAELTPTRPFCLTCHQPQAEHYAAQECTTCHLDATPAAWRPRLTRAEGA
jgi:hypothetical protein